MLRVVGGWQQGSLCGPGTKKLHINTASSRISISVYSAGNNKGWTKEGQTVHKKGGKDDSGEGVRRPS